MIKNAKIKTKVIFFTLSGFFFLSVVLSFISITRMNVLASEISNEVLLEKLKGDINSSETYLKRFYGDINFKDQSLVDAQDLSLEGRFDFVDTISEELNVVATIFIKEGDDFKRISTSIKKDNGERAVGTK
ncbi:MAG TPA: Cache 3/Cache 2 fusion domain-containing protein, partial [Candidatus Cloacimonadota bacterium]|nr:Cache 3/Cache 2 fusion domain-containing protein [Candidatus Cloacimonadota bacterium]